jgi:hypothetical protein
MCRAVAILYLLSIIGLPSAIWFALDARIARLNPWIWAVWGFLSVTAPSIVIFKFFGFVREGWLSGLLPEGAVKSLVVWTPLAGGWFTAFVIYKWVLKPKRVAIIGTSLNYVGGWLGTFIFHMFFSAAADLGFYASETYQTLTQVCPGLLREASFLNNAITATPGARETGLMILGAVGASWAAIALIRKRPFAIRLTGCVLLSFVAFGLLPTLDHAFDIVTSDDPRSLVTQTQQTDKGSAQWLWSVVWLGYLIRSKRVREVYGRNFWRSPESSGGGVPT